MSSVCKPELDFRKIGGALKSLYSTKPGSLGFSNLTEIYGISEQTLISLLMFSK